MALLLVDDNELASAAAWSSDSSGPASKLVKSRTRHGGPPICDLSIIAGDNRY